MESSSTGIVSPCETMQSGAPEGGQPGECSVSVGMTGLMVGRSMVRDDRVGGA